MTHNWWVNFPYFFQIACHHLSIEECIFSCQDYWLYNLLLHWYHLVEVDQVCNLYTQVKSKSIDEHQMAGIITRDVVITRDIVHYRYKSRFCPESGICFWSDWNLDFVWTRSKPGSSLNWVKIQILILKIRKIRKIENSKIENSKDSKIENSKNLKIWKNWNLKFENSKNRRFLRFFICSKIFLNFQIFLNFSNSIFNVKTEIWFLSRPSQDSNRVPDQNLDIKKSRIWT